ncbi:MAG: flagellar protein export ATPase FliI [Alphaproteobacteria bacterium]|nr:flagellar protein export ATPase FliI [Alphaproteobacteria bacterium]
MKTYFNNIVRRLDNIAAYSVYGEVSMVRGLMIEVEGTHSNISVGERCEIFTRDDAVILAEVIGFRRDTAITMAYGEVAGIKPGARVRILKTDAQIFPTLDWLGRTIDAFATPLDGFGPLPQGDEAYPVKASPLPAHERNRIGKRINLGVKGLNVFTTCCMGQRMGIFSGSGVGKSTLLSMIARFTSADVIVIGLIGERGREVQDFIIDDLGVEGLKRAVVVVATSDDPALTRREAAYTTLAVAEYFRDQGKNVLCLMDSVTRFAMAQREIGLSVGEPPASKGYTPTVFAELPRLLERAGPGRGEGGSITGLFTVLVEGDDLNEPISDAVRGILDGHIVLSRDIAHRNRYPAIDVLGSISRMMPNCNSDSQNQLIDRARSLLSTYRDMEELIRIGAYRQGTSESVDAAIYFNPALENFFRQLKTETFNLEQSFQILAESLEMSEAPPTQSESASVAG